MGTGKISFFVALYLFFTAAQTAYFLCSRNLDCGLIAWSLPTGAALGIGVFFFEQLTHCLQVHMAEKMRPLHTGFLLFFFYLIGYMIIFSALNSFPFERILGAKIPVPGIAADYGLYTGNITIVLAFLSWLNWVRAASSRPGRPCAIFEKLVPGHRK